MNPRFSVAALVALAGVLCPGTAPAADMMMNAQAAPAAAAQPAPQPPAAAAPKPPAPPEDVFQRYGKILSPGDEPSHPLKLSMPFPDVGEVKIPSPQELSMRDKLERLSDMSDADIRQNLESWPAFSKMSLKDEGMMLMRIQMFKDRRAKVAQDRAHALGLLTLKPDQFQRFEAEYWQKRMKMDVDLARQFGPAYKARENQLEEELFREFSTPSPTAVAQIAKPPVVPVVPPAAKPPSPPAGAAPMR